MVNSKAIHCSTPSATYSTCSTSTRGSWQIIPRMGRKKVDRWRHRAELVNQGATQAGAVPGLLLWAHIDQSCWRYFNLCDMQNIGGSQFEFGQTANQWFCREFVGFLWLHERPKINSPHADLWAAIFSTSCRRMNFQRSTNPQRSQCIRTPLI